MMPMSAPAARLPAVVTVSALMVLSAPSLAWAESALTYEVWSSDIAVVDLEYVDNDGRKLVTDQSLPWRRDIALAPGSAAAFKAQLRADWRPVASPGHWVTVTISKDGRLLCQSTLDVGNVTCYGNVHHVS